MRRPRLFHVRVGLAPERHPSVCPARPTGRAAPSRPKGRRLCATPRVGAALHGRWRGSETFCGAPERHPSICPARPRGRAAPTRPHGAALARHPAGRHCPARKMERGGASRWAIKAALFHGARHPWAGTAGGDRSTDWAGPTTPDPPNPPETSRFPPLPLLTRAGGVINPCHQFQEPP